MVKLVKQSAYMFACETLARMKVMCQRRNMKRDAA